MKTKIKPFDLHFKNSYSFAESMWSDEETQSSVYWLCRMAKAHGSWRDFTKREIDIMFGGDFWFNNLILGSEPAIIQHIVGDYVECEPYIKGGVKYHQKERRITTHYSFTEKFVEECFRLTHR